MPSHKQAKQILNIKKKIMYISKHVFVLFSLKVKLTEILPSVPKAKLSTATQLAYENHKWNTNKECLSSNTDLICIHTQVV